MPDPSELLLPAEKPRLPCSETPGLRLMEGMAEYMTEGELLAVACSAGGSVTPDAPRVGAAGTDRHPRPARRVVAHL